LREEALRSKADREQRSVAAAARRDYAAALERFKEGHGGRRQQPPQPGVPAYPLDDDPLIARAKAMCESAEAMLRAHDDSRHRAPGGDDDTPALVAAAVVGEDAAPDALREVNARTRRGLLRITRVAGGLALVILVLAFWRVDLVTLAERGVGARFGADLIGALVIAGAAYAL
ncbi:MAG: hypothetical protein AAFV49_24010, partial [Pseudomonadota bacterium]